MSTATFYKLNSLASHVNVNIEGFLDKVGATLPISALTVFIATKANQLTVSCEESCMFHTACNLDDLYALMAELV